MVRERGPMAGWAFFSAVDLLDVVLPAVLRWKMVTTRSSGGICEERVHKVKQLFRQPSYKSTGLWEDVHYWSLKPGV